MVLRRSLLIAVAALVAPAPMPDRDPAAIVPASAFGQRLEQGLLRLGPGDLAEIKDFARDQDINSKNVLGK